MDIHIAEGGIGRHVFFTAILPKLAEKEKVSVMSSYTDIFENNPYVHRSYGRNSTYIYEDLIKKDGNKIIFRDPYFNADFINNKIHVIEAWCQEYGIEYTPNMLPQIYLSKQHLDKAKEFKKEVGPFIVVQFSCGQSPFNQMPQNQMFQYDGFERKITKENAQWIINFIKDKYPSLGILNMSLPNENMELESCIHLQVPYIFYAAALTQAEAFIGVNSCLMHFAAAFKKEGICLWGGSSPKMWGYDFHTHISGKCSQNNLYCTRPYLRELGDFVGNGQKWMCPNPICMDIDAEEVSNTLDNMLSPTIKPIISKKLDLSKVNVRVCDPSHKKC